MFSLKIDVDNKGGRVWTTGEPDEIYGAIGTVTVEVLNDVIPKIQQNLSPKQVFDSFCDAMSTLLRAHFGAQYEVRPAVEKEPQSKQHEDDKKPTPEEILEMMDKLGADGIVIELTESGFLESNAYLIRFCNGLKERGIPLALDDFGTGYSNFHYL